MKLRRTDGRTDADGRTHAATNDAIGRKAGDPVEAGLAARQRRKRGQGEGKKEEEAVGCTHKEKGRKGHLVLVVFLRVLSARGDLIAMAIFWWKTFLSKRNRGNCIEIRQR